MVIVARVVASTVHLDLIKKRILKKMTFKEEIQQGIPNSLPSPKTFDPSINHAPKRKDILSVDEKKLALKNALRYFDAIHHEILFS